MRRSVEAQKQKRAEWVLAQMCRSAEWDCPVLLHFCNQIMNCSTDRKIPQQTVQLFLTAALLHIETYKSRSLSTTWILVPPVAHAHDTPSWISRSCRRAVKHKHASTPAHAEGHHSCLYRSYEQNTSKLMRAQSEKCRLTCLDRYAPVLVKHR